MVASFAGLEVASFWERSHCPTGCKTLHIKVHLQLPKTAQKTDKSWFEVGLRVKNRAGCLSQNPYVLEKKSFWGSLEDKTW